MKKFIISDFEIINYGIDNIQYFRGITTYFTNYEFCIYDVAYNEREALKAAIDRLCEYHDNIDVSILKKELKNFSKKNMTKKQIEHDDLYHHIGILYNLTEVK